jgi:hypothetical protein
VNLTREETRRLGLLTGADALAFSAVSFRELAASPVRRVEAYLALFLADARSGALVRFAGCTGSGDTRAAALAAGLDASRAELASWGERFRRAEADRASAPQPALAVSLDLLTRDAPAGARPPRFYRKPAPAITADAARAHVSATVDLVVRFEADGRYGGIEVDRWAGYGLDEAAVEAVLAAPFVPAALDGREVSCRALLRYNFRVAD